MKTSDVVDFEETKDGWKTKFLELYISGDLLKFRQAFDLKRKHIPPKLYRYRALSDDSIIKHRFGEIVLIMGMKISEEHEKKIREYAELAGIPVTKATQTEYGLKID